MQLRQIAPPRVVLAPTGFRIRTRLRVNEHDAVVLRSLGTHLGRLANIDLMVRCQLGPDHDKRHWAARKRALTAESSSRWAGAITKCSMTYGRPLGGARLAMLLRSGAPFERLSNGSPAQSVAMGRGERWPAIAAKPSATRSNAACRY